MDRASDCDNTHRAEAVSTSFTTAYWGNPPVSVVIYRKVDGDGKVCLQGRNVAVQSINDGIRIEAVWII